MKARSTTNTSLFWLTGLLRLTEQLLHDFYTRQLIVLKRKETVFFLIALQATVFFLIALQAMGFQAFAQSRTQEKISSDNPQPCLTSTKCVTITKTENPQNLILSDGSIWNLRGLWVPDMQKLSSEINAPIDKVTTYRKRIKNRYGEFMGPLFTSDGRWLQEFWVLQGLAAVWPFPYFDTESAHLLTMENKARLAQKGIWSQGPDKPDFYTTSKKLEQAPFKSAGKFMIVEGRITSTRFINRNEQAIIYINFGNNYRNDFTIVVRPPWIQDFREQLKKQNIELRDLKGQSIRARGILSFYNGPQIEICCSRALEIPGWKQH